MEDTLRGGALTKQKEVWKSLNPCSNGRYSQRVRRGSDAIAEYSLNPCSNGRYSQSYDTKYIGF